MLRFLLAGAFALLTMAARAQGPTMTPPASPVAGTWMGTLDAGAARFLAW